jgi:hypothetical protein
VIEQYISYHNPLSQMSEFYSVAKLVKTDYEGVDKLKEESEKVSTEKSEGLDQNLSKVSEVQQKMVSAFDKIEDKLKTLESQVKGN